MRAFQPDVSGDVDLTAPAAIVQAFGQRARYGWLKTPWLVTPWMGVEVRHAGWMQAPWMIGPWLAELVPVPVVVGRKSYGWLQYGVQSVDDAGNESAVVTGRVLVMSSPQPLLDATIGVTTGGGGAVSGVTMTVAQFAEV